jgi:hypothetical protein
VRPNCGTANQGPSRETNGDFELDAENAGNLSVVINNNIAFWSVIGIVVGYASVAQRQHSHPFGSSNIGPAKIADMGCTRWINPA